MGEDLETSQIETEQKRSTSRALEALGSLSISGGFFAIGYGVYEWTSTNLYTVFKGEANVEIGFPMILAGGYALYKSGLFTDRA